MIPKSDLNSKKLTYIDGIEGPEFRTAVERMHNDVTLDFGTMAIIILYNKCVF